MARIRKTISFKPEIIKRIDESRGNKQLSTQVNEDYEELHKLKGGKKKKK